MKWIDWSESNCLGVRTCMVFSQSDCDCSSSFTHVERVSAISRKIIASNGTCVFRLFFSLSLCKNSCMKWIAIDVICKKIWLILSWQYGNHNVCFNYFFIRKKCFFVCVCACVCACVCVCMVNCTCKSWFLCYVPESCCYFTILDESYVPCQASVCVCVCVVCERTCIKLSFFFFRPTKWSSPQAIMYRRHYLCYMFYYVNKCHYNISLAGIDAIVMGKRA